MSDQPEQQDQSLEHPPPSRESVGAVTLKIPPFWPADPQIWFAQVEAQFHTKGITAQKTHFDHVVASLAPEFALEVRHLILSPPVTDPYKTLKAQLIERTAASDQRRLQQLFHSEDLGDRKPTQLLRRMQQLLGDKMSTTDATFLRELFLQRLPSNVRMVLAAAGTTDLAQMASLGDKIIEVATPMGSTLAQVTAPPTAQPTSEIDALRSDLADLRRLVENLAHTRPSRPRSTSRSRAGSRTNSPAPSRNLTTEMCWYHAKFGTDAKKCRTPCSYTSGNKQASHQ